MQLVVRCTDKSLIRHLVYTVPSLAECRRLYSQHTELPLTTTNVPRWTLPRAADVTPAHVYSMAELESGTVGAGIEAIQDTDTQAALLHAASLAPQRALRSPDRLVVVDVPQRVFKELASVKSTTPRTPRTDMAILHLSQTAP